ncbi:uncharacterized protein LOC133036795 [Cannabis sativa]|uniref:uncharacterized protein LOC133036795 n=1 Tax=Cannabis sativa TaxID=3483 RepID=UPI0029C9C422|nr:uncharacterized protein LOC133036795 [Cannabis sativa]
MRREIKKKDPKEAWPKYYQANFYAYADAHKEKPKADVLRSFKEQFKLLTDEEIENWAAYEVEASPSKVGGRGKGKKVKETLSAEPGIDNNEGVGDVQVSGRCSFERLGRIVPLLNEAQKEMVRNAGFSTFLREDAPYIDAKIVSWLIDHVDPTTSRLEIFGRTIQLSAKLFEDVMGIRDGGEPVATESERDTGRTATHVDRTVAPIDFWTTKHCKSVYKWIRDQGGHTSGKVKLTNTYVLPPSFESVAVGQPTNDAIYKAVCELKDEVFGLI